VLVGMTLAFLTVTMSANREVIGAGGELRARYLAEAAIAEGLAAKRHGGRVRVDGLASLVAPVAFGGVEYEMDVIWGEDAPQMGDDLVQMTGAGRADRAGVTIEMLGRLEVNSLYVWGAFGDVELTMDSNAHVDSYDSSLGSYASQQVNGSGSDAWANDNGDVGSNGDIDMQSNSTVNGDATSGPVSTTSLTGNAIVSGSTAPNTVAVVMPPLLMPSFGSSGDLAYAGSSPVIPSGNHEYGDFTVGGNHTLTIIGPATIVADDFEVLSNAEVWIDATTGPVSIYVRNAFIMDSNTMMASTTYDPWDLSVNLNTENITDPTPPEVSFDSNTLLYGTLFAPHARIDFDSNTEIFGAVMSKDLHLDSNSFIHYDENLLENAKDAPGDIEILWWRTVAGP
jgi:hypothetical protein